MPLVVCSSPVNVYYNLGRCVAIIVMKGRSYVEFYIRMVFVWVDERPMDER